MSLSTPSLPPTFLFDENVRVELARVLKAEGFDVKVVPRSSPDDFAASVSKREERVLVTNDFDFCEYTKDEIFGVIWLRIPQNNPKELIASFGKLLNQLKVFSGRLITLEMSKWTDLPLFKKSTNA